MPWLKDLDHSSTPVHGWTQGSTNPSQQPIGSHHIILEISNTLHMYRRTTPFLISDLTGSVSFDH